jgi:hypothetical protein
MAFARLLSVLFFAGCFAWPASCASRDGSPLSLVVTYHTAPGNRAVFRKGVKRLALTALKRLQREGKLQSYTVLFSRYVDSTAWDAMILLTFTNEAGLAAWKSFEEHAPAGLSAEALSLTTKIDTAPADLIQDKATEYVRDSAVFLVIPYEIAVSGEEYAAYLAGYVSPQLDGWMGEGVLGRYRIFLARYPAGRPWHSLLVLEYKSEEALGARDATVAKVRARLKENPEWKAISDTKKTIRIEKIATIADPFSQSATPTRHKK